MKQIFITGGTGYMGSRLILLLMQKGHTVTALIRSGSEKKMPEGCAYVIANPFDATSFSKHIPGQAVFIQLLGVAHPGPKKKEQFKTIDLASVKASAVAAKEAGAAHFIYVSVAQTPASIMHDYQHCRALGENAIRDTQIPATFIRPWYVIGPGHYWPLIFQPVFKILEWVPATAQKAKALRLVGLKQMLHTLLYAAELEPFAGINIIEIDTIRRM
ncbi:MAG TPA: SDR family oxidoreductase [Panacibacter sp.]|nr:SDR family oxidoreductase [Panacibacter sp.]